MLNVIRGEPVETLDVTRFKRRFEEELDRTQGEVGIFPGGVCALSQGGAGSESRVAKQMMRNEFCLNTGFDRKYAIRLLDGAPPGKQPKDAERATSARAFYSGGDLAKRAGILGRCG
jgi:hypothetical protein